MFVVEAFALGSLAYAGCKFVFGRKSTQADKPPVSGQVLSKPPVGPVADRPALAQARRNLRASQSALGLAVVGAVLRWPLASLASLPLMLLVVAPVYGEAWLALRQRRVDMHVLDAARVSVCVAMGYSVIAALNALLHASSQSLFLKSEADLREALQESLGSQQPVVWVECAGVETPTSLEQIRPGMVLALRGGDIALVAGVVVSGSARVAPRFAEDLATEVNRGDPVAAGSRVLTGSVSLRVETVSHTSCALYQQVLDAPLVQTPLRRLGELAGGRMAPWMLAAFALTTPLMGINRSSAFLTTSFGAQMHRLGPYTVRQFIGLAACHGIFIREPRALELASLVNTVIFDTRVLAHPAARPHAAGLVHALRLRHWPSADALALPFAAYAMADSEEDGQRLAYELGLDGYFVASEGVGRADLIGGLQLGGRLVCYVGSGRQDAAAMRVALLSVEVRGPACLDETQAHIALLDPRLRGLPGVFDLGAVFTDRQSFNLLTNVGIDLLDISSTIFLHFGLVYSVLLSYAGLLSSAAYARMPRAQPVSRPAASSTPKPVEAGQKLIP